jgi:hypothetical protein
VCEILDGAPFVDSLSFKNEDGSYIEPGGATRGYYVQGVRVIPDSVFVRIVASAEVSDVGSALATDHSAGEGFRHMGNLYARSSVAREVEAQSRAIVVARLRHRHKNARIDEMPTNYPGYDLETNIAGFRFVEVKGTQAPFPRFALSEGERRFGAANRDEYLLAVVFGMDLAHVAYRGIACARAPLGSAHGLAPIQWNGHLSPKASGECSYL